MAVDMVAPTQMVTIISAMDDVGAVKGAVQSGGATDDATPTLSGVVSSKLGAGEVVQILRDDNVIGTAAVSGTGWTFTDAGLADSTTHQYTARVTDSAGNVGSVTAAFVLTVSGAPLQANITAIIDNVGLRTGIIANGGATDDTSPTLVGTLTTALPSGYSVKIYDGTKVVGTAIVSGTDWSFEQPGTFANGTTRTYTARIADASGAIVGLPSAAYAVVCDTSAPSVTAAISYIMDDVGTIVGTLGANKATDDKSPTLYGLLTGTMGVGDVLEVLRDGVAVGTVTSPGAKWSYTDTNVAEGKHVYGMRTVDAVGNINLSSTAFTLTIDTVAPLKPTIVSAIDDVGMITGIIASGGYTNDQNPLLSGTLAAPLAANESLAISIIVDGSSRGLYVPTVSGTGWSYASTPTNSGISTTSSSVVTYIAQITDTAGNVTKSDPYTLKMDIVASSITATINSVFDDAGILVGSVKSGGIVDDNAPTLMGSLSGALGQGDFVQVYRDSVAIGTAGVSGRNWGFVDTGVSDGVHAYNVRVVDIAGNAGKSSANFTLTIDTLPATQAVEINISHVIDNVGRVIGTIGSGGITDDTTPVLVGSLSDKLENVKNLASADKLFVFCDGNFLGNANITDKSWTYSAVNIAGGQHEFVVRIGDAAGNLGASYGSFILNVDASDKIPLAWGTTFVGLLDNVGSYTGALISNVITDDASPELIGYLSASSGSSEEKIGFGQYVVIKRGDISVGTAALAGNVWSYSESWLADGTYSYSAYVADTSGNVGKADTFTFTVDTTAPTQKLMVNYIQAETGSGDQNFASGVVTGDATPKLVGSLDQPTSSTDRIEVLRDNVFVGTATLQGPLGWTFSDTLTSDGEHFYGARVRDAAGNAGAISAVFTMTLDTAAPKQTVVISNVTDDVSSIADRVANPGLTNDASPTLNGSISDALRSGDYVEVLRDSVVIGTATVSGTSWSYLDADVSEGTHSYTAHVVSMSKIVGADSSQFSLTVLPNFTIADNLLAFGNGSHTLDLTQVPNNAISGIEIIDIGGDGANTIKLSVSDVIDLSSTTNILRIGGGGDDTVELISSGHFTKAEAGYTSFNDGVTYNVYTNSMNDACVYIDQDISNVILT
ncbi:MAG: Ig-like domain-containing protein [Mesorhizobium sp.]